MNTAGADGLERGESSQAILTCVTGKLRNKKNEGWISMFYLRLSSKQSKNKILQIAHKG